MQNQKSHTNFTKAKLTNFTSFAHSSQNASFIKMAWWWSFCVKFEFKNLQLAIKFWLFGGGELKIAYFKSQFVIFLFAR